MSDGDVAVTVTPGRIAPCVSLTNPVSRPCVDCAHADPPSNAPSTSTSSVVLERISPLRTLAEIERWPAAILAKLHSYEQRQIGPISQIDDFLVPPGPTIQSFGATMAP